MVHQLDGKWDHIDLVIKTGFNMVQANVIRIYCTSRALSISYVEFYPNYLKVLFDRNPSDRRTDFAEDAEGKLSS